MEINQRKSTDKLEITTAGRLDTTTAPQLGAVIASYLDSIKQLTFDLGILDYISSAVLRVLLNAQKIMNKQGCMKVCHVNSCIM